MTIIKRGGEAKFTYRLITKKDVDFIILSDKKILKAKKLSYKYYAEENIETLELYSSKANHGYILRRRKKKSFN